VTGAGGRNRWLLGTPGVLALPSGRLVRGRSLRALLPQDSSAELPPQFGIYLLGKDPGKMPWPTQWVAWPDFGLPRDRAAALDSIRTAWERSARERVEVACAGGRGRTGTVLACMAVLEGMGAADAIAYVRLNYERRAVETPWQRRFVSGFVTRPERP
jgi:hypothetical protein